ncbi:MAG: hypothetical protein GF346_04900 [Candidatus Eisenbacteria bacterium]|nr:hypothetical protein [Candidatus Latescibacterota bacterium]MBD3301765.1 hypothetical protein [Candidatus Eisenbacteria bacterium]
MKKRAILWTLLIGILVAAPLAADPLRVGNNDGAVLYLSLAPELTYSDTTTFRGLSATPFPEEALVTSEPSPEPQIAFVLASYPPDAKPELSVVSYGIRYSPGIRIVRYGITPNALQMATRDWPLSGEGMMLGSLEKPDTSMVSEIGWMAIVAEKPGVVELVPHPDPRMAARIVSATPPDQWPLAALGSLGFGEPGYAPIPVRPGPRLGATCVHDTLCYALTEEEVAYYRERWEGETEPFFLGEGVSCSRGAPCTPMAASGACCLPDGSCVFQTRRECVEEGGIYVGDDTTCDSAPCEEATESEKQEEGKP